LFILPEAFSKTGNGTTEILAMSKNLTRHCALDALHLDRF
jgi:hypothetical protein